MVQPAGTPLAPDPVDDLPEPSWRMLLGRGLPQFFGEGVAPVLVFYGAWRAWGLGAAIAASTAASLTIGAFLIHRRRDIAVVAVGVTFVFIQALVALAAHSATVYLAQPVVLSALWGIAYFSSVLAGRPLIGVFANTWYPFPPWFRRSEPYRREFGMQSVVWGVYCLARAALRIFVLLYSGIGSFVAISVITGFPVFVALVAWGIWHARRRFSQLELPGASDRGAPGHR